MRRLVGLSTQAVSASVNYISSERGKCLIGGSISLSVRLERRSVDADRSDTIATFLSKLAMVPTEKLVRASQTTKLWLQNLRERIPHLKYTEAKFWATFKAGPGSAVAQLNPSQRSIRVFLSLDLRAEPDLKPSPSTRPVYKRK